MHIENKIKDVIDVDVMKTAHYLGILLVKTHDVKGSSCESLRKLQEVVVSSERQFGGKRV